MSLRAVSIKGRGPWVRGSGSQPCGNLFDHSAWLLTFPPNPAFPSGAGAPRAIIGSTLQSGILCRGSHSCIPPVPPLDGARIELIEAAKAGWVSRLIDTSRRNNLLCYRSVPTSSIDVPSESAALIELLGGASVPITSLMPEGLERPGHVLAIARKAQENSEEKGLQTLYVAFDFAMWTATDGGRDPKSPIFLVAVATERKGRELSAIEIQIAGETKLNPLLLHMLGEDFNVRITEEELLEAIVPRESELPATEEPGGTLALAQFRAAVMATCKSIEKGPRQQYGIRDRPHGVPGIF
jgi:hypothetical protein